MKETWQAQNVVVVARDIQAQDQRDARRELFSLTGRKIAYASWTQEQKHLADMVMQLLNTAAYLQSRQLLPRGVLEENWGNVFRNVYTAGRPRLDERRASGESELWPYFVEMSTELLEKAPADPFYP